MEEIRRGIIIKWLLNHIETCMILNSIIKFDNYAYFEAIGKIINLCTESAYDRSYLVDC